MWNLETSETVAHPRPILTLNDVSEPWTCLCSYAVCNILKPPGKTHVAVQCSKSPMNKHIARSVPPMQGCPGSRQVSSAQPQASKGERGNSKVVGEELPPPQEGPAECEVQTSPQGDGLCGAGGSQTPALLHSVCCQAWCTGQHTRGQQRAQVRRTHKPFEILERRLFWDGMRPKKTGRIWPVSEKIDGLKAPSLLKARFRSIYVSLDRDMKPD